MLSKDVKNISFKTSRTFPRKPKFVHACRKILGRVGNTAGGLGYSRKGGDRVVFRPLPAEEHCLWFNTVYSIFSVMFCHHSLFRTNRYGTLVLQILWPIWLHLSSNLLKSLFLHQVRLQEYRYRYQFTYKLKK
jgi:hypothetical protein